MSSVSLIQLTDKVNHKSTELSINYFKKTYTDGQLLIVNTQHTDIINHFAEKYTATIITPSKKLNYPKFNYEEIDDLLFWTVETFFKPAFFVDTDYFVWSEPDCFIIKKTNFDLYKDIDLICCNQIFWLFLPIWDKLGIDNDQKNQNMQNYFSDLSKLCEQFGKDFDKIAKNDLRHNLYIGTYINTDKVKDLYYHKNDEIIVFVKQFAELTLNYFKKYSPVSYKQCFITPDYLLSIIFSFYEFKWKSNPNYEMIGENERYTFNVLDNQSTLEVLHPVKTYYTDKNQSFEKIVGKSL